MTTHRSDEAIKRLDRYGKAMRETYSGFQPANIRKRLRQRKAQIESVGETTQSAVTSIKSTVEERIAATRAQAGQDIKAGKRTIRRVVRKLGL